MPENIGFIGLGVMGKPMAKHLVAAGHRLIVHNRSRGAVDELVGCRRDGRRVAGRGRDGSQRSSSPCCLTRPTSSGSLTGPDGVLSGLQAGAVVIDMSSISPVATERLAAHGRRERRVDARRAGQRRRDRRRSTRRSRSWSAATRPRSLACVRFSQSMGNAEKIIHIGRVGRGADLQGLQPGGDRRRARRRQRSVRAREEGRRRRGAGAPGAARRLRREPRARSARRADARPTTTSRDSAPGCIRRICGSRTRPRPRTAVAMPATAVVAQLVNALVASGGADLDYAALGTVLFRMAGGGGEGLRAEDADVARPFQGRVSGPEAAYMMRVSVYSSPARPAAVGANGLIRRDRSRAASRCTSTRWNRTCRRT